MNTQSDPLKESISNSDTIANHLRIAEKADQQVRRHAETREAAHAEVKRIKSEWIRLLEVLQRLKDELGLARECLQFSRSRAEGDKHLFFRWQTGNSEQFWTMATRIATTIMAVGIQEEQVSFKVKALNDHIEQMRAFGADHGVDKESLETLGAV